MKRKYSDKYFVWQQLLSPFVNLIGAIHEIILLPTPYHSKIYWNWLKNIIVVQGAKRTAKFNKEKRNSVIEKCIKSDL